MAVEICCLQLTQAKADGSYTKLLKLLSRTHVLILDDWGLEPLQPVHRHNLLEILDDRHDATSTVVISQLPLDQWYVSICLLYTSPSPRD